MPKTVAVWGLAAVVVFALAIQAIPYGRSHTNPPVREEPAWNSPQTRDLAARACFDCHSNQTTWPWYSNVAPVSWLVQRDVDKGRHELNFSEMDRQESKADESAREVERGRMPQWYYVVLHPAANLSAAEKATLVQGLIATFGQGGGFEGREGGRGESKRAVAISTQKLAHSTESGAVAGPVS